MLGRRLLGFAGAALSATLLCGGACGYQSEYVAPADGRPRVVWGPDDDPVVEVAGNAPSPECGAVLRQVTGRSLMRLSQGRIELPETPVRPYSLGVSGGYWTPRYYGSPIVVAHPGVVPLFRPPFFSPSLTVARIAMSSGGGLRGGGGGLRLGGGNSDGLGKAAVLLLVIAATALPAIDIGLAASTPESRSKSSEAIDLVNGYNDLLRSSGTACSVYAAAPTGAPDGSAMPGVPGGGAP